MSSILILYCNNGNLDEFAKIFAGIKSNTLDYAKIVYNCNVIIAKKNLIIFYDYFAKKGIVNNKIIMKYIKDYIFIEHIFNNIGPKLFVELIIDLNEKGECHPRFSEFLMDKLFIFYSTLSKQELIDIYKGSNLPVKPFVSMAFRLKRTDINYPEWRDTLIGK